MHAARELGVPDERITTIAAQVDGITPANGADAAHAIDEVARLVAAGQVRVPIAASFPVEQIRAAVELQAGRHVHGKVVIDLSAPFPSWLAPLSLGRGFAARRVQGPSGRAPAKTVGDIHSLRGALADRDRA